MGQRNALIVPTTRRQQPQAPGSGTAFASQGIQLLGLGNRLARAGLVEEGFIRQPKALLCAGETEFVYIYILCRMRQQWLWNV